MKKGSLKDMFKGWFIGEFSPTLFNTDQFEVAIKRSKHVHKIATEFTVIVEGEVEMNGVKYIKDDIIIIEPNEYTDFRCLTDVVTTVVKVPCVKNDKYE
jgi:hypothetical protein